MRYTEGMGSDSRGGLEVGAKIRQEGGPASAGAEPNVLSMAQRRTRLIAYLVDLGIMGAALMLLWLALLLRFSAPGPSVALAVAGCLSVLGQLGLNLYWLKRYGQSIGKRALDIRIAGPDGEAVGLGRIVFRRLAPVFVLGRLPGVGPLLLMVDGLTIFRPSRRCLHDDLAGTRVLQDESRTDRPMATRGLIGVTVILAIGTLLLTPVEAWKAEGPSMEPTLLDDERFVTLNLFGFSPWQVFRSGLYRESALQRGDIVVLVSPADGVEVTKRIMGLPGDHIDIDGHSLHINEIPVEERPVGPCEHGRHPDCQVYQRVIDGRFFLVAYARPGVPGSKSVEVPEGQVYVLGDRLDQSNDSRNPEFGTVPLGNVVGVAALRHGSHDHEGRLRPERIFDAL